MVRARHRTSRTVPFMHGSVTVHMNATPDAVWRVVSDVTRVGEFSPETFEAEWLDGGTGPAAGARFRGHVKRNGRGPTYWTVCDVVACVPEREFAFAVVNRGKPINTWTYRLEPAAGGTDVTESFRLTDTALLRAYWALAGRWRSKTNDANMRTTLQKMKAVVERAS